MSEYDSGYVPRSAMTIFAHPDDAEFMVSGTVARWTKAGCEVAFVLITSGNAGTHDRRYTRESLTRVREEEQREAARLLGVSTLVFLGHDDCALQPTIEVRRELVREIRRHRPEVVICGDPQAWFYGADYINHPDHRAAAEVALDAVFPCAEMELLWPDAGPPHKVGAVYVGATLSPNVWVDIDDTIDAKIASLKAHASQIGDWDPSDMIRKWAGDEAKRARRGVKRGVDGQDRRPREPKYVEGFRVMALRRQEKPPES